MEYKLRKTVRHWGNLLLRGSLMALVAFLIIGSLYAGLDPQDNLIHPGVRVGGIDLGGMSMERAC